MGIEVRIAIAVAAAFAVTFVASKIIIPLLKKKKAEQHVRDDGPQTHLVKEGTPTMGGIMIVMGIVAAALVFSVYADDRAVKTMVFLVGTTLLFMLIGFIDDSIKLFKKRSLGLRAWQKIVLELVFAAAVACYSYFVLGNEAETIPLAGGMWELGAAYIPFTMFVFIAMVNSVNLTDGLDGLATGLTLTNATAFLVITAVLCGGVLLDMGDGGEAANTAIFCAALMGACIAFLFFNKLPAKVFMGDTGSFALGAAITAIASVLGLQLLLPIMGLMFVLSAISVIIQVGSYKLRKKRVFRMAPLHHHFELGGMTETQVVKGYTAATVLLSILAVLSVWFLVF
jgi:phospho-N-acetylmuramoyl-pentapeptide-transferase